MISPPRSKSLPRYVDSMAGGSSLYLRFSSGTFQYPLQPNTLIFDKSGTLSYSFSYGEMYSGRPRVGSTLWRWHECWMAYGQNLCGIFASARYVRVGLRSIPHNRSAKAFCRASYGCAFLWQTVVTFIAVIVLATQMSVVACHTDCIEVTRKRDVAPISF